MFTVQSITNPVYANAEGTMITCDVKFEEFNEVHPFGANKDDIEEHGRIIYADLVAGKYGAIGEYVAPPQPTQPKTTGTQTA